MKYPNLLQRGQKAFNPKEVRHIFQNTAKIIPHLVCEQCLNIISIVKNVNNFKWDLKRGDGVRQCLWRQAWAIIQSPWHWQLLSNECALELFFRLCGFYLGFFSLQWVLKFNGSLEIFFYDYEAWKRISVRKRALAWLSLEVKRAWDLFTEPAGNSKLMCVMKNWFYFKKVIKTRWTVLHMGRFTKQQLRSYVTATQYSVNLRFEFIKV